MTHWPRPRQCLGPGERVPRNSPRIPNGRKATTTTSSARTVLLLQATMRRKDGSGLSAEPTTGTLNSISTAASSTGTARLPVDAVLGITSSPRKGIQHENEYESDASQLLGGL